MAGFNQRMLNNSILQKCSEDMDSDITIILYFLEERMQKIEITPRMEQGGQSEGGDTLDKSERKWDSQLREVAEQIDGIAIFVGGRWLRSQM